MWIIVLFFGAQLQLCSGEGMTFMLSATSIAGSGSNTWVVITGQDATRVTLTSPAYNASRTVVVGAENSTSIPLMPQVMYRNSCDVQHKGIQVVADQDVSVQVVTSISGGNTESYQALPKTAWSDEYYVSLYTVDKGGSSFVTIAAYNNDTSVNITIPTSAGLSSCEGMTQNDGRTLSKTLQSMDVWGVRCDKDLTGTYIHSSKAISVVAGITDSKRFFMEAMIPVQLYGVNFVLPNITDCAIVFRVVASDYDTEVNTCLDKGCYVDIDRMASETMCIRTSKPVQIQMLLWSPDSDLTSFMMTIAPVERYLTTSRIPPSPATVTQRLMIYVTEKSNKLSLEGELQHVTAVEELECCNYISFAGWENVDNHLSLNLPFPVMILQYSVKLGGVDGHSAGFNMSSVTCPTEKGYQYDKPSNFCFKVGTARATWMESMRLCDSWLSHHLASLDSQSKNMALKTFMGKNFASESVWTGGQAIPGSEWRWPNNVTFSTTNNSFWAQSQPDGSSSCLALYAGFYHQWDDLDCSYLVLYACELRLEALPSVQLLETSCAYENPACPFIQGYRHFSDGNLCIKPYAVEMTWTKANSKCQAHGDRLVKVDSRRKAALITSFAARHLENRTFFIGGSRQNTSTTANYSRSDDFVWTDCSPIGISLWREHEPNNHYGVESCVHLDHEKMNDIACTNMFAFICEKTNEAQLVSDIYDGSCLEQNSSSSGSYSVDVQPSSLFGGDGSSSVSSDAGVTSLSDASSVTVSTPSIPATVFLPSTQPSMIAPTAFTTKRSDTSVNLGSGSILVSTSDLTIISTTSIVTASTTTGAADLTILATTPGLTPVSAAAGLAPPTTAGLTPVSAAAGLAPPTTAGLTPSPTTVSGNTPTLFPSTTRTSVSLYATSLTSASASPDVTPPGEWNISSWDRNWDLTFGPWELDRVSGRWKRLVCRCVCVPQRLKTLSPSGVQAVKENIVNKLILDNKNLTKKAAKYSSAKDERTSARGMGYSAMCLVSLPIILIVLADLLTCLCSVNKRRK